MIYRIVLKKLKNPIDINKRGLNGYINKVNIENMKDAMKTEYIKY